jgi:hypothetical protein
MSDEVCTDRWQPTHERRSHPDDCATCSDDQLESLGVVIDHAPWHGTDATPPLRNVKPDVPDVRA